MCIDVIALSNTVSKEDVRYVMAHNPLEPLGRSTIDQMIAAGELKEPSRRGRYRIWTKEYIAEIAGTNIESINNILRAVQQMKEAS